MGWIIAAFFGVLFIAVALLFVYFALLSRYMSR